MNPTPSATEVPPSGFFDSGGVKIHYETWGEGYPIILVHGIIANLKLNWLVQSWVETLRPIRRVVALDCRGHGESDKPHDVEAYGAGNMAGDVLRLMDYLGIEKADLFGYSMGSAISAYLLAHHGERFSSAILGGTGEYLVFESVPEGETDPVAAALLADDASQVTELVPQGFRAFAEAVPNSDLKALGACAQRLRGPVERAELADVAMPVLIVNAANEFVGSPDEVAAAIPGARLVIIPDTDHLTVVPDQRFKDAVLAFLKGL
jgi:pimeloyl-ACP methyl ester carboxylesterase